MTITISNRTSQHCNLLTKTILEQAEKLNVTPKIITHNIDQKVTIEVYKGIAETIYSSDGIEVEIIDHDNEGNS